MSGKNTTGRRNTTQSKISVVKVVKSSKPKDEVTNTKEFFVKKYFKWARNIKNKFWKVVCLYVLPALLILLSTTSIILHNEIYDSWLNMKDIHSLKEGDFILLSLPPPPPSQFYVYNTGNFTYNYILAACLSIKTININTYTEIKPLPDECIIKNNVPNDIISHNYKNTYSFDVICQNNVTLPKGFTVSIRVKCAMDNCDYESKEYNQTY